MEKEWHGLTPFARAMEIQNVALEQVQSGTDGRILGFEHPEVLTLGIRSRGLEDVLCMKHNFSVERVQRGGEATIHNEGQLVIYPVVSIDKLGLGARCFVDLLMNTTGDLLSGFGIETQKKEEPGLFTEFGKIAFFGLRIRKGIASHGLSINLRNDLSVFDKISVCGVKGAALDRVENYKAVGSLQAVFEMWNGCFEERLNVARTKVLCVTDPGRPRNFEHSRGDSNV